MIKKKILIADDDTVTSTVLKMTLERAGFEIIAAMDGSETVSLAKKELPDLIILDVMMPGYDGFMVNKILEKDVKTKEIPVFVVTALGEAKKLFEENGARIDAYFDKPVDFKVLVKEIAEFLKRKG